MLTIKECRDILKEEALELTDAEIIEIRDWLSMMADITLESIEKLSTNHENKQK